MEPTGKINKPAWIADPETWEVMEALFLNDGDARFVGGCVRDSIVNRTVYDIDIATPLTPKEVIKRLKVSNIKYIPTGLEHGTITAIVNGRPYEITTLRKDIETHGRHATVEFTDNWEEDAARRDLTMNAIFCSIEGEIYDPFNGITDLREGRIRFVGNAHERIQEDILRILRFFRFYAHFGKEEPDAETLKSCKELAPGLENLSAERIQKEVLKLLSADNAGKSWKIMKDNEILPHVIPEASHIDRLDNIINLEDEYHSKTWPIRRLAVLIDEDPEIAKRVGNRLKLSNDDKKQLIRMVTPKLQLSLDISEHGLRKAVYIHGNDMTRNFLLLASARTGRTENLGALYKIATSLRLPRFPIRGQDILDLGVPAGPKVGEVIKSLENWWIEQDFSPKRRDCLDELERLHKC